MTSDDAIAYRDPDWVAQKLGLEKNTVYKFLQDGTIPAIQLGRKWLVSEARLAEWLRQETEAQTRARREAATSAERTVGRMENLSAPAQLALKHAHSEARRYNHPQLGQEHLLLGLTSDADAPTTRALKTFGLTPGDLRREIERAAPPGSTQVPRRLGRSADAKRAMRIAGKLARRAVPADGQAIIGTDHLLLGILLSHQGLGHEILRGHDLTRKRLKAALADAIAPKAPLTKENSDERSE
jgi:excisionase family DNA binding protein